MLKKSFQEVKPASLQTVDSINELVKFLSGDRKTINCSSNHDRQIHCHVTLVSDWLTQTQTEYKVSGRVLYLFHAMLGLLLYGPELYKTLTG